MKVIIETMKKYSGRFVLMALLYVLQTIFALYLSYEVGNIVNYGIAEGDMSYIIKKGLLMAGATVLSFFTGIFVSKLNSSNQTRFICDLQKKMFAKINSLTSAEFNSVGAGGLITRSTDDIFHLQWMVSGLLYSIVSIPVMFIGGMVLTIIKDWVLGVTMAVAAPIVLVIVIFVSKNMSKFWNISDKYIDIQNSTVRERLSGIRVIRSFDTEEREHIKISAATDTMARYIIRANVRSGSISSICTFMLDVVTLAIIALSFPRVGQGITKAGDVISALQYVSLAANGLLTLSWTIMGLPHIEVCIKRIQEVMDFKGEPDESSDDPIVCGDVSLKNVTYYYPAAHAPALENVSMTIDAGEIVGIIGATGSGKSTIIKLLLRFADPTDGDIAVGGRNYKNCGVKESRSAFSTALQKSMIFEGTVRENIEFGNSAATLDDIKAACDVAMIAEFIESQPDGYDHRLAKLGTNVSGGQKQLIAIARVYLANKGMLILDEASSNVDTRTELLIQKTMDDLMRDRTSFVIAHRLSTIVNADLILVVNDGEIVEKGTHKELLDNGGLYTEIYNSQYKQTA